MLTIKLISIWDLGRINIILRFCMVWTSFFPKNNSIQFYYEFDFMFSMSKLRGYAHVFILFFSSQTNHFIAFFPITYRISCIALTSDVFELVQTNDQFHTCYVSVLDFFFFFKKNISEWLRFLIPINLNIFAFVSLMSLKTCNW